MGALNEVAPRQRWCRLDGLKAGSARLVDASRGPCMDAAATQGRDRRLVALIVESSGRAPQATCRNPRPRPWSDSGVGRRLAGTASDDVEENPCRPTDCR
jgi:hypothetical protein